MQTSRDQQAGPCENRTARADIEDTKPPGLNDFMTPEENGLSLNELRQAYAALLAKGSEQPVGVVGSSENLSPQQPANDADLDLNVTPKSILEAILFVGHATGEPLMSERIAALIRGVQPAEIDDLVRELNDEYEAHRAAYLIESDGGGYKLALRPHFGPLRDVFHGRIRQARLSQAAVDILAIVGYHQPVAADEINRLRGKPSEAILLQLVRRDLLAIERPADKKSKPVYRTTGRFLDLFGLEDLSELPKSHEVDRQL